MAEKVIKGAENEMEHHALCGNQVSNLSEQSRKILEKREKRIHMRSMKNRQGTVVGFIHDIEK